MRRKVLGLVSNNIATDQRLIKVGSSLLNNGFEFELIGSSHISAPDLSHIPFQIKRLKFFFNKNFPFYAELQIRLFLQLLRTDKKDIIILANDLDTLLPAKLISVMFNIPLIVDFHEIFAEMPTLKAGSVQKITWQKLEKLLVPLLQYSYTVSDSYRDYFHHNYNINPEVILNVPVLTEKITVKHSETGQKIIIYQGAMNYSRGIDKLLKAMPFLENVQLLLIGNGPCAREYQQISKDLQIENKVKFMGMMKPEELKKVTPLADLGLSLEEDNGLSYRYALPNKIFDYIHAGIPVLGSSDLKEVSSLIYNYKIGDVIQNHNPEHIALKIKGLLQKDKREFSAGLEKARAALNWQNQEKKLISLFQKAAHE